MINTKSAPITPCCVRKCYLKQHCVWPGVGRGGEEDLSSYTLSISPRSLETVLGFSLRNSPPLQANQVFLFQN